MWLSQKKKKNLRTGLNDLGGVIGIPGRILEIMAEIFHIQRTSSSIDTKKKKKNQNKNAWAYHIQTKIKPREYIEGSQKKKIINRERRIRIKITVYISSETMNVRRQ